MFITIFLEMNNKRVGCRIWKNFIAPVDKYHSAPMEVGMPDMVDTCQGKKVSHRPLFLEVILAFPSL
ncbi:MAG: hypothetical protein J7J70_05495 [Deltaproteobacteria bacterium]|nr:hypothetical protein [Candidatus Tharpellaceae bacterium]